MTPDLAGTNSLEALQHRMLRRFLWILLFVCAVLGLRDTLVGYDYMALPLVAVTGLAGLAIFRRVPRARAALPVVAGLAVILAVAVEVWDDGRCVTPASAFLLVALPLVTLMGSLWGGWALTLLAAGLALGQAWRHPPMLGVERRSLNDFLVLLFSAQMVAWIFQRSFSRLQGDLRRQQQALEGLEGQNRALSQPLFARLPGSLARLEGLLGAPGPLEPAVLAPLVDEIQGAMHQSRGVALGPGAAAHAPVEDAFLATRSRFIQAGAWGLAGLVCLSTLPLLLGGNAVRSNLVDLGAGLLMLGYLAVFGARRHAKLTVWALLLPEYLAVCYRAYYWGPGAPSPATPELPVLVLFVGLAVGYRSALAVTVMGVGLLVAAWLPGAPGVDRLNQDLNVSLCLIVALAGAGQVLDLHRRLSASSSAALKGQEQRLDRRRRILGLLFQDLMQPLSLISLSLEQAEAGLSAAGRERLLRQVQRVGALLKAAQPVLGEPAGRPQLVAVRLARLLRAAKDELEPALVLKGQRLYLDCPEELNVLSVPELLQASVLTPLLLNAVRHNPEGASVAVRARAQLGEVSLWISDQGPGFPEAVIEALQRGRPVPHGSEADAGVGHEQGLGLDRAWDHSSLLGGRLNIYNRVEGGAVVQVLLPLAQDEGSATVQPAF
jgi:signal transduction histidine kinase